MTRLLAVADLHLGAGAHLSRGSRLAEQAAAWRFVCDLAAREDCNAVVLAGDVFEWPRPSPDELAAFRTGLEILAEARIPLVAITGNAGHDQAGAAQHTALDVFHAPRRGVLVYRRPRLIPAGRLPGVPVSIGLLPWTHASWLVAAQGGGDRDAQHRELAEHLVGVAEGMRSEAAGLEAPCLLVLHWSVSGAVGANGKEVGLFREVVLPARDLVAQGWDAIAAGHIHRVQTLGGVEHAFYCGSLMVKDWGEAVLEHGVHLLDFDAERLTGRRFVPVPDRRFVTIELEPGEPVEGLDVEDAVVRVRWRGSRHDAKAFDAGALRRDLLASGAALVTVLTEIERETRLRVPGVDESVDPLEAIDLWIPTQDLPARVADEVRVRTRGYIEEEAAA